MSDGNEKIEVWANPVGPGLANNPALTAVGMEAYHTTTVYTDKYGGVHFVEGQPGSPTNPFGGYLGSWGNIVAKSGQFPSLESAIAAGNNPMANPYATKSTVKVGFDLSADFQNVKAGYGYVESKGIPYGAGNANSNAATYTALQGAGLTPPALPDRPTYGAPITSPGQVNAPGWGTSLIDFPDVPPGFGPATVGVSFKEFKDYYGTIDVPAGISVKEYKDYYGVNTSPNFSSIGVAPSSIASMLDNYGIGTPSVGSMNVGSVPSATVSSAPSVPSYESPLGIAASLDMAGKGLSMGIGSVGVPATGNFATPSLAEALSLAQKEAAMAAAAAARHEAFVAQTAVEADVLNNQQLAEIAVRNAVVDRWTAAAGYYGAPDAVVALDEKAFAVAMTQGMVPTMVNATISAVGMFAPGIGPAVTFAGLMSPHEAAPATQAPTAPTTQYGMIEAAFTSVDANGFTSLDNGALRDFMNQTAPTPGQAFGNTGMTVIEAMQVARESQNGKGSSTGGSSNGTAEGEATETPSGPAGPEGNPYADREAAAQGKSSTESGPESGPSSDTSNNDTGPSGGPEGGSGDGGDGEGGGAGSASEGSGSYAPVVLDLDGDGVELVDASAGARYDTNDDGAREHLGWAGRDDGLLAIDLDGDGKISQAKELSFAMHTDDAGDTDLQGLAKVFDSNKDGVLDRNDSEFSKFRIWQDKDGDGISDKGEVKSLSEMGIKSIGVISDGKSYIDAGNTVHGTASYIKTDGTTAKVGDVDFKIAGRKTLFRHISYIQGDKALMRQAA